MNTIIKAYYSPGLFTCPKSMTTTMDVRALANKAAQALGYNSLKEDKMKVVLAIAGGQDGFAVLPTG